MKKYLVFLLCVCTLCALSVTAFASQEDYERYEEEYSIPKPLPDEYESEDIYLAAFNAWASGFRNFVTQKLQEEAALASDKSTLAKPSESAGTINGNTDESFEDGTSSKYPVGSYVDVSGAVFSPDGTRLSPDAAPALAEDTALLQTVDSEVVEVTVELLYDLLSDVASDTEKLASDDSVAYVVDLRSAGPPVTVLTGLKSLVTSIFGEYTPVTTNTVVTQTIGNDTYEYLVETVAPGAAGVDYEWLAGVFLFGILLFCFMKLLGGVLK